MGPLRMSDVMLKKWAFAFRGGRLWRMTQQATWPRVLTLALTQVETGIENFENSIPGNIGPMSPTTQTVTWDQRISWKR
jgi:hypothetical protein